MPEIVSYSFNRIGKENLEGDVKGRDWPVVYLIHNDSSIYIGETTSAVNRMDQHLNNLQKKQANLKEIDIIFDDTYNKSVILDFEQKLIKYFSSDKKFKKILNRNAGQSSSHDYFDRKRYYDNFKELWNQLYEKGMTNNPIDKLENLNIFKYSPYNSLTEEQNLVSTKILEDIIQKFFEADGKGISLVNGGAGTGKTVLAISMINSLVNAIHLDESELSSDDLFDRKIQVLKRIKDYVEKNKELKIGFVFPMNGTKGTIKKVFRECGSGLTEDMIISPYELKNKEYDILFIDEAHRLKREKNLSGGGEYSHFTKICNEMKLDPEKSTQLDWVIRKAKYKVLFYDENQTIKPTDVPKNQFIQTLEDSKEKILNISLHTQMRCLGGNDFVNYINKIMTCQPVNFEEIRGYEFRIFDNVKNMIDNIRALDDKIGLCKTVAGFSWKWKTAFQKKESKIRFKDYYKFLVGEDKYDIDISGNKYIWNLDTDGWTTKEDSHYTIGCIHSIQGADLNYVGVIFGREIDYDPVSNQITIDPEKFCDINVKKSCEIEDLKKYIINTYLTMMTRGIKGCYVYAYNDKLREYLKEFIKRGGN